MKKLITLSCLFAFGLAGNVAQAQDITDGPEFSVSKKAFVSNAEEKEIGLFLTKTNDAIVNLVIQDAEIPQYSVNSVANFCFMGKKFEFVKIKDSRTKRSTYTKSINNNSIALIVSLQSKHIPNSKFRYCIRNVA